MAFSTRKQFTAANVNKAPQRAGVYKLYDSNTLIYIGRASGGNSTIRTRLQAHISGRNGRCTQNATAYAYDTTIADITTERQLLQTFRQTHGRLPRCNDRMP